MIELYVILNKHESNLQQVFIQLIFHLSSNVKNDIALYISIGNLLCEFTKINMLNIHLL